MATRYPFFLERGEGKSGFPILLERRPCDGKSQRPKSEHGMTWHERPSDCDGQRRGQKGRLTEGGRQGGTNDCLRNYSVYPH